MEQGAIYLASASPRRRELLGQIGVRFHRLPVQVDEALRPGEGPGDYVQRLALAKARAGWDSLGDRRRLPVLGADTAIALDDRILGKPADRQQALAMLKALSGRTHRVMSAVALVTEQAQEVRISESRVTFRTVSDGEARAYWASGEPVDKAGAYAIQGLGALFVSHLEGSSSGVMGLPLFETAELLRSQQVDPLTGAGR